MRIKRAAPECGSTAAHKLLSSSVNRFFQSKCRRPSSKPKNREVETWHG